MSEKFKELEQHVRDTQEGISPEQLKALIEAETGSTPTDQAPVEPAPAPTPQAPIGQPTPSPAPTPAPVEPTQGQPNVLDLIPEKFRSKDVPTSLANYTKSYADMEADLRKQKDEMANLNKLVQSFMEREPAYTPPMPQAPVVGGDIDDATVFEKPTESIKRIAKAEAAAQILAYHNAREKQTYVENFRANHPDFETYREDLIAILRARPDLDKSERNLPVVYELAKQRYSTRMSSLRRELGISDTPAPASQPAPASIDIEAISQAAYEKARQAIAAEISQRQAAAGIQGSSPATTLGARVQPRVTEKPLTDEEEILKSMIEAGPKKLILGE